MSRTIATAPPNSDFDPKFIRFGGLVMIVIILFFTWLHWFQPHILRTPDNTNVSAWTNPPFEHTAIYERMTPAERERVLNEGVPGASMGNLLFMDISGFLVAWLCLVHARRHWGDWMAFCFLFGSFIFTGLQESLWILFGRFTGLSAMQGLGESVYGTYWFTKGGLWFLETPAAICVGWFYLAYTCVWAAHKVFPDMGLWGRAVVGAFIAVIFDFWVDPVATSPEVMTWVWATGDFIRILGIPHTNFLGWFFLVFCFAVLWEQLPGWEVRWGRARATALFFMVLFVTEVAILAFMVPWSWILRSILVALGATQTLYLPPNW